MPEFRVFLIGQDGHIAGPSMTPVCDDDQEAISKAATLSDDKAIELGPARASSFAFRGGGRDPKKWSAKV
jgi:hypothetical protein